MSRLEEAHSEDGLAPPARQNAAPDTNHELLYDRLAIELFDIGRLHQISTLLIREGDVDALYRRVLDAAVDLMGSDMASMQMLDPHRGELQLLAFKGFDPESAAGWQWIGVDSKTTCGAALRNRLRVIAPDLDVCDFVDREGYRRAGIRAVQSTPLVARSGKMLGMISTHWRVPHQPEERRLQLLDVLARQAADLIERAQIEAALRENVERFRALVEASAQIVWTTDADGAVVEDSPSWRAFTGQTFDEWKGSGWTNALHPDDIERVAELWRTAVAAGAPVETEYRVRHVDGGWRWTSVRAVPLRNGGGRVRGWVGMNLDITERKRADEKVVFLANEAEHRAKNVLAIVQAAVRLTQSETPAGFKEAIEGRIQALANVHGLLAQSHWQGAALRTLVMQELAPYRQDGTARVQIDGPDVLLEPDLAQAIAVTLHELATNAAKYGALSLTGGKVKVDWSRTADGGLVIRWGEAGGPAVKPPKRNGFGTRAMETMIRAQLNGELRCDWRADELVCEIALPATPTFAPPA